MKKIEEILKKNQIFFDSAPIIYWFDGHSQFNEITKKIVNLIKSNRIKSLTSVLTLTEVLPIPMRLGDQKQVDLFLEFIQSSGTLELVEIDSAIAKYAGNLRSKYSGLKSMDALQISAAINTGSDIFLTNDLQLNQVKEIEICIIKNLL